MAIPVIIDTDVDFDDYLAILYLLKHPKNEVFHSGLHVDLVTLNACDDVPVTQEFVNRLKKIRTGTAQFAYQILTAPDNVHGIDGYFRLWDPLAA